MKSIFRILTIVGLGLFVAMPAFPQNHPRNASSSRVEDIYILHSVREIQLAPSDACPKVKTGFETFGGVAEKLTFRSTATRGSDGLMTNTNVQKVGYSLVCVGPTASSNTLNYYVEATLGTVSFKGRGKCVPGKLAYPEDGVSVGTCYADVFDLPKGYVGGQMAVNYLDSRTALGTESDPSGYTQTGIDVVRLWKRR